VAVVLDKTHIDVLSEVRHDIRQIVVHTAHSESAQKVQKDQALKPFLEPLPESPIRQLSPTLSQQIGGIHVAGFMPEPAERIRHFS
jgi:hypothetical protein